MSDDREQLPGFPEALPPGERVLWVGGPDARGIARHVLHVRALGLYFAALVLLPALVAPSGEHLAAAARAAVWVVPLGVSTLAFLYGFARLVARGTVYALTERRVAMRVGVALPTYLNLPLGELASADIKRRGGLGDITFTLGERERIAYMLLWPHARPFHFARPRPAFRCVRDADAVAALVRTAAGTAR